MKVFHAIRRFVANAWFAAAPLVIFVLIVGVLAFVGLARAIVARLFGPNAADQFLINAMMLAGALVALLLIGFVVYGLISVARWLLGKKGR